MGNTSAVFVAWLRSARKETRLTQQKLADALNAEGFPFHQTTVAKIEAGTRPILLDEAAAVVRLFGTTLDAALGLTPGNTTRQLAARTQALSQIRTVIDAELGGEA